MANGIAHSGWRHITSSSARRADLGFIGRGIVPLLSFTPNLGVNVERRDRIPDEWSIERDERSRSPTGGERGRAGAAGSGRGVELQRLRDRNADGEPAA